MGNCLVREFCGVAGNENITIKINSILLGCHLSNPFILNNRAFNIDFLDPKTML